MASLKDLVTLILLLLITGNRGSSSTSKNGSASTASSISTKAMEQIVDKLRYDKKRTSTKRTYYNTWKNFNKFIIRWDRKPPNWEDRIVLYVGYLTSQNKKSTTIRSYISAIRSVQRDDGVSLNEDKYLLSSLTKACKLQKDRVQIRLPIQKGVLEILIRHISDSFLAQPYLDKLFKAIFSTAYYRLLRVGELTYSEHVIQTCNVHVADNKQKILFFLRSSKTHGSGSKPQMVKITGTRPIRNAVSTCPFRILREYIKIRPLAECPEKQFFVFVDNSTVKPANVRNVLNQMLNKARLDHTLYGMHSFRIGRASDLLKLHFSVETIKKIGRWCCNVIYTYLRN